MFMMTEKIKGMKYYTLDMIRDLNSTKKIMQTKP